MISTEKTVMWRFLYFFIFVASALTIAGASLAATSKPSPPNVMRSYDFVVGRWRCDGITPQGKIDYTFTQDNSRVLGGFWFKFHAVSSSGTDESFMTYEPKAHLWRYISVDDSGAYSMGTASDWVGNKQTWTGYWYSNGTRRSWGRITFTKIDDRKKREDFYEPGKSGTYRFVGSEICTKQT